MKEALIKLLKIKSIVTILLTLTFVAGAILQQVEGWEIPEALVNIYLMVVGFYFGTQFNKDGKTTESDLNDPEQ
jgi:uncharacterized membrane protein AbrB (regulator of aidB expression)